MAVGVAGACGAALIYAMESRVSAGEIELHAGTLPWTHNGPLNGLDMGS